MPTQIKARGNAWLARVVIEGKEVDSKLFPPGHKKGPEWLAARQWEVKRKKELQEAAARRRRTLTGLELLWAWGDAYLARVDQTMARKTLVEKQTVMRHFFGFCRSAGVQGIEDVGKPLLIQWLSGIASERGADRANRYRKNLLAAWHWGIDAVAGFPQDIPPLERIKPFPVDAGERYLPPEEDIIRVLQVAQGQDLVMLLTFYYTGARRGEVFRLRWDDVNSRATTTDIYVRSAGLYSDQRVLVDALGESGIGQAANALLEEKMPHELAAHEAFCKQGLVNSRLQ